MRLSAIKLPKYYKVRIEEILMSVEREVSILRFDDEKVPNCLSRILERGINLDTRYFFKVFINGENLEIMFDSKGGQYDIR